VRSHSDDSISTLRPRRAFAGPLLPTQMSVDTIRCRPDEIEQLRQRTRNPPGPEQDTIVVRKFAHVALGRHTSWQAAAPSSESDAAAALLGGSAPCDDEIDTARGFAASDLDGDADHPLIEINPHCRAIVRADPTERADMAAIVDADVHRADPVQTSEPSVSRGLHWWPDDKEFAIILPTGVRTIERGHDDCSWMRNVRPRSLARLVALVFAILVGSVAGLEVGTGMLTNLWNRVVDTPPVSQTSQTLPSSAKLGLGER